MSWYLKVLKNYAVFSGRARRQEYWMFVLFNVLISVGLNVIDRAAGLTYGPHNAHGILHSIYSLAVLLPSLAVSVRRLHDIGKSGWSLLVALIPCIGAFILLYWHVQDGEAGDNAYGPNPKTASSM
jgi:uncharacterized membrane protein YhaH (DUF805 family)